MSQPAANIEDGKTRSIQFKFRDKMTFGEVATEFRSGDDVVEALKNSVVVEKIITHEVFKVDRIGGDQMRCEIFRYV